MCTLFEISPHAHAVQTSHRFLDETSYRGTAACPLRDGPGQTRPGTGLTHPSSPALRFTKNQGGARHAPHFTNRSPACLPSDEVPTHQDQLSIGHS